MSSSSSLKCHLFSLLLSMHLLHYELTTSQSYAPCQRKFCPNDDIHRDFYTSRYIVVPCGLL